MQPLFMPRLVYSNTVDGYLAEFTSLKGRWQETLSGHDSIESGTCNARPGSDIRKVYLPNRIQQSTGHKQHPEQ